MERRLAALVLISTGVAIQWGPGFGLIVAGALLACSGLEGAPLAARARLSASRLSQLARTMPRRAAAVTLVVLAAVALPVAGLLAAGAWAAWAAVGGVSGAVGVALGRE